MKNTLNKKQKAKIKKIIKKQQPSPMGEPEMIMVALKLGRRFRKRYHPEI